MRRTLLPLSVLLVVIVAAPAQGQRDWPNFPYGPAPARPVAPLPAPVWAAAPASSLDDFAIAATTPLPLLYLEQPSVREELKLSDEQIAKVEAISSRWFGKNPSEQPDDGFRPKSGLQLMVDSRKGLETTLTAAQMKRLKQIMLRHREREHGMPAVLSSLGGDLNLSAEQQRRFEELRGKRAETVLENLTSGERVATVRQRVSAANNDFVAQVERALEVQQRDRLKDLFGAPFAGAIKLREPVAVPTVAAKVYLTKLFGHYSVETEFLVNESVQKELRMTADQVRRAKEFHVEWSRRVAEGMKTNPDPAEVLLALDDLVEKELSAILKKPQQHERFVSIMMQYRARVAGIAAACGYPDAAGSMKLDANQDEKLRQGAPADEVLIRFQMTAYQKLVGAPFDAEVKITNPLLVERKVPSKPVVAGPLVDEKQVVFAQYLLDHSRRMKLDAKQVARLKEIAADAPKVREILHRELSNLPPPAALMPSRVLPEARALEVYRKSIFDNCLDVLDRDQRVQFGGELKRACRDY